MVTHHLRLEITDVIKALEEIGENLANWFSNNEMKLHTKASTTIHPSFDNYVHSLERNQETT